MVLFQYHLPLFLAFVSLCETIVPDPAIPNRTQWNPAGLALKPCSTGPWHQGTVCTLMSSVLALYSDAHMFLHWIYDQRYPFLGDAHHQYYYALFCLSLRNVCAHTYLGCTTSKQHSRFFIFDRWLGMFIPNPFLFSFSCSTTNSTSTNWAILIFRSLGCRLASNSRDHREQRGVLLRFSLLSLHSQPCKMALILIDISINHQ